MNETGLSAWCSDVQAPDKNLTNISALLSTLPRPCLSAFNSCQKNRAAAFCILHSGCSRPEINASCFFIACTTCAPLGTQQTGHTYMYTLDNCFFEHWYRQSTTTGCCQLLALDAKFRSTHAFCRQIGTSAFGSVLRTCT